MKKLLVAALIGATSLVGVSGSAHAFTEYQAGANSCAYNHANAVTGSQNLASTAYGQKTSFSNSTTVRKVYHKFGGPGQNLWQRRGLEQVGTFSNAGSYAYCYS